MKQQANFAHRLTVNAPIIIGLIIIGIFFVGFGSWALLAPLNAAAIASGTLVLDLEKKTIQHLEGGMIAKIWVTEGQAVAQGQSLIDLDQVAIKAQVDLLTNQLLDVQVTKIRITAEHDGITPDFSLLLEQIATQQEHEKLAPLIATSNKLFNAIVENFTNQLNLLQNKVEQLAQEILGLQAQKDASSQSLSLLQQESKLISQLVATNNASLMQQTALDKQIATAIGSRGQLQAAIAKAKQAVAATKLERLQLIHERHQEILSAITQNSVQVSDLQEQLRTAKDILSRTHISAPVSGIVMDIKYHTVGAVVAPGGELMYIVPQQEKVIVRAKVLPDDIDLVRAGLRAKVSLSAYKAKKVPKLSALVLTVSADSLLDEQTGMEYFAARVKIDPEEIAALKENVVLYPGMPAQVFILTGVRTMFDYLIAPFKDATYRAFREE
jgi:HlyD family secretion protein